LERQAISGTSKYANTSANKRKNQRKNDQMKIPDYIEYLASAGGEVRYYHDSGKWRYVCAQGEGSGFTSLAAAQTDVRQFTDASKPEPVSAIPAQPSGRAPERVD
jgi:hypothetical protein